MREFPGSRHHDRGRDRLPNLELGGQRSAYVLGRHFPAWLYFFFSSFDLPYPEIPSTGKNKLTNPKISLQVNMDITFPHGVPQGFKRCVRNRYMPPSTLSLVSPEFLNSRFHLPMADIAPGDRFAVGGGDFQANPD